MGSLAAAGSDLDAAVSAGDPRALYDKASTLADSRSAQRDLAGAVTLYRAAAEKRFAPAQYRLGSMYEKGLGLEKDVAQAKVW